tara:strand:- start:24436 stop:25434 length:999 start_codon:yes stop_codon:yes gene_type:complete
MPSLADALATELEKRIPDGYSQIETIFFGGGTPSLLPREVWKKLAKRVAEVAGTQLVEWSIETNPRTFDERKAEEWLESGVTRASLGVQSFDATVLETLGRDHSSDEASESARVLKNAGFAKVSLDLMFAIPGQSLDSWRASLEQAIALEPDHISTYNLTYEEDTEFLSRFEEGEWSQDPDRDAEYFALAHEVLESAGFEHYEVSNYAKPDSRSLHNQAYWSGADYLGIGPSAVSTICGERSKNVANTETYVEMVAKVGHALDEVEILSEEDQRLERVALGLRTQTGLPVPEFDGEFLKHLSDENLIVVAEGRVRLTLSGMMVADEIAGYLV